MDNSPLAAFTILAQPPRTNRFAYPFRERFCQRNCHPFPLRVRAGLAQAAIRLAEGDGLLTVQEQRHQGRRSDPNLIRIISREWQAWMKRARRIGCKPLHPTDTRVLTPETIRPVTPAKKLPERQGRLGDRGGSGNLHSGAEWSFCLTAARIAADQER